MHRKDLLIFIIVGIAVAFTLNLRPIANWRPKAMVPALRMAINFNQGASSLDPSSINTIYQHELISNLYGRLLEYNSEGQLVADVPDSVSWSDTEVTFTFGTKVKTLDGHVIDSKDAEFSLKRLIASNSSGHGDIRRFLCPNFKLIDLDTPCPGIRVEGNKLILSVIKAEFLPQLISTLETGDFSIIPRSSTRKVDGRSVIVDYLNTSGPYYVAIDSADGALVLRANPNHYHFNVQMPQEIQLIPSGLVGGLELFLNNQIDLLPTMQMFSGDEATKILNLHDVNIHQTLPIQIRAYVFSPHAMQNFSADQRLYAATMYSQLIDERYPLQFAQKTQQFFQPLGEGSLSESQIEKLSKWKDNLGRPHFESPIEVRPLETDYDYIRSELKDHKEFRVNKATASALSLPIHERPDLYVITTDTSWTESITLLAFNFNNISFSLPGLNPDTWLKNFIGTTDKASRIALLNKLHFDLLMNASIVPTHIMPYFAVSKKTWALNQWNLSAGMALWRMRVN